MSDALIVLLIIFVMLYLAFLFWYGGRSKPLTEAEIESLLAEIKRRGGKQSQEGKPLLFQQFRNLAKSDDGREFYMVNLMKFRQKALYPEGSSFGEDPMVANNIYNRAIIPLLLKHGGSPVFLGQVQGRYSTPIQPTIGIRSVWCAIAVAEIC
jgi:hypothetical protein